MAIAAKPSAIEGRLSASAFALARVLFTPWGVTGLFAVIYLATLTSDYFWDGITFALQIEKVAKGERSIALLFHQNHLLYNAFGYLLYVAARALGLSVKAL